jgi:hypothetical protein
LWREARQLVISNNVVKLASGLQRRVRLAIRADEGIKVRRSKLKAIGRALVGALLFNALSPLSVLAQDKGTVSPQAQRQLQQYAQWNQKIEQAKADKARSPADQAAEHLKQAQDAAAALRADQRARSASATSSNDLRDLRAIGPNVKFEVQRAQALNPERRAEHAARLKEHLKATRDGQAAVRAELEAAGKALQKKSQPTVILERQQLALAQFDQRAKEFEQLSTAWLKDQSDANLTALADFFERNPAQRKAAPFDAKKLPWSSPKPTTRTPAETAPRRPRPSAPSPSRSRPSQAKPPPWPTSHRRPRPSRPRPSSPRPAR